MSRRVHRSCVRAVLGQIAALLFVACFAIEAIADRQMFEFQTEKYRRLEAKEELGEYQRGFIETGLWAFSRHPNYLCVPGSI